uniref:Small ribosomal subunit protein uS7m n=1 Tax=Timema poppense TaxID=170557 RepID=A0A7R9D999_TIMPO|nr:unnamed protein product [Timema poppensis]
MSTFRRVIFSCIDVNWIFCNSPILKRISDLDPSRSYSQYAPYFIEPIFKKEKQEELYKTGEVEKISHVPIKAALNDQTSSVFYDEQVRKFTNYVMEGGKKTLARQLVEKTFENVKRTQLERFNTSPTPELKENIETNPLIIFYRAVENCKPLLQLSPIKRGGVTYQVPVPITEKRSNFLAMKWLIEAAQDKERTVHFPEKLAWELLDASLNQGRVVKRKQELHRQCEANRAYAHYRWS